MVFKRKTIHHILLFPPTPWVEATPYQAALSRLQHNTDLWWTSKGVDLTHPTAEVIRGYGDTDTQINVHQDNPWYDTLNWLNAQPFYVPTDLYVVHLYGWYSASYAGWGGRPLAVVGDYELNALASVGNPDSIWDDTKAGFLVMHEEGHALGLQHDFSDLRLVMSYGWQGYNSILGQAHENQLRSEPLELGPVVPQPEGCQLFMSEPCPLCGRPNDGQVHQECADREQASDDAATDAMTEHREEMGRGGK